MQGFPFLGGIFLLPVKQSVFMRISLFIVLLLMLAACDNPATPRRTSLWVKCDTVRIASAGRPLMFPARVKAAREVNLAFKVGGRLSELYVSEGDRVRRIEPIARLDARDYKLQLQAAEAEYRRIKADAERAFALYADSVITAAEYDKARYGLQQITAKYDNAKSVLADTELRAPFDGAVVRTLFRPPAVVAAGVPVVRLQSSEAPELLIHIPASLYRRRKEILSFVARFDFLDAPVPLTLINISPDVNANQLYAVRLALPATMSEEVSVGLSAVVKVFVRGAGDEAVEVPVEALFRKGDEDCVWVVADGRATLRRVRVSALHTDGWATVASGLSAGEIVVSGGVHAVDESRRVSPLSINN